MEKTFDFNTIGKRMPYSVPDGFFDRMEEKVVASLSSGATGETPKAAVKREKSDLASIPEREQARTEFKKTRIIKIAVRSAMSAAAALALFFVVRATIPKSAPILALADDYVGVEQAFDNLSTDDQEFLITIYEDEEYINDLTNTEYYE